MKTKIILSLISFTLFVQSVKSMTASGFSESEQVLKTSSGDLHGTLTVPDNVQNCPFVLIIPGSGPTDRDGNSVMGLKANTYKMLAVDLAINNIASLRIDKRGVGKSQLAINNEADLLFETYIDDVVN